MLLAFLVTGCQSARSDAEAYYLPAEWEPQEAVWVSFFGGPMDSVSYQMVRTIARYTPVKCVIPPDRELAYSIEANLKAMGVDPAKIEVIKAGGIVQTRDVGPIFVRNSSGDLRIVDFGWNNYGDPDASMGPNRRSADFDSLVAARLQIPLVRSDLVMEGGAFEANGKGTLLQVEAVTLQRNPGMSKQAIEDELKRVLGQKKIVWLKEGPADDPQRMALITRKYIGQGVGGHVDEFARFVDPHTILLAIPDSAEAAHDPVKQITYDRMRVNYEILKNATDQDGKPFTIVTVPVPNVPYRPMVADTSWTHPAFHDLLQANPQIHHGDTLYWVPASSYLNYFVSNKVVLIPAYWRPGWPQAVKQRDDQFREVIHRYFPDREIISIDPYALNMNGGGLHCWTQQQPAG